MHKRHAREGFKDCRTHSPGVGVGLAGADLVIQAQLERRTILVRRTLASLVVPHTVGVQRHVDGSAVQQHNLCLGTGRGGAGNRGKSALACA